MNLRQWIQSNYSFNTVRKFLLETIEGLKHIASKGEIHGDIKPENILITFQNTAVISDFGLGGITPIFCPPEVFANNGNVVIF